MGVDVFLSYAHEDEQRAERLARCIEEAGMTVFWNRRIPPGASWQTLIQSAFESARAIVVVWSAHSVASAWVQEEADSAKRAGKLIPVLLDDVKIPFGFSSINAADLRHWDGSSGYPELRELLSAVARVVGVPGAALERKAAEVGTPGATLEGEAAEAGAPGAGLEKAAEVGAPRPTGEATYERPPGASRTRIFVAHASADKPKLKPILATIVDQGFRVWIDRPQAVGLDTRHLSRLARDRIQYGDDWQESIRIAVGKADVVLAFWSKDVIEGRREQFHYEVYMGMMQRKLKQCRIDDVELSAIGMPYTFDHVADLSTVEIGTYSPELDFLMQDLASKRRPWWRFR